MIANLTRMAVDDENLSAETIRKLEEGLADIKAGRTQSLEDVMAELDADDEQALYDRAHSGSETRSEKDR